MKPHLLKVPLNPANSFSIRHDLVPYFYNHWHYHPEVELIHIHRGSGTQFLGDSIGHFNPDDMVLVGSNLTHMWRCDEPYFNRESNLISEATVIHFMPDFLGQTFMQLPENTAVVALLEKAKQGLFITGKTKTAVGILMQKLMNLQGSERIICLLRILNHIAVSGEIALMSSQGFHINNVESETSKMDGIYQYVVNNFKEKITLTEIAAKANIAPKSFCRYFKSRTRKTFSRFLMEVRIGHACKLLSEKEMSISDICYESGFNNTSNFNRYFKLITKTTPLHYKKEQQKVPEQ